MVPATARSTDAVSIVVRDSSAAARFVPASLNRPVFSGWSEAQVRHGRDSDPLGSFWCLADGCAVLLCGDAAAAGGPLVE